VVAFFVWLYALRKLQGVGWLGAPGLAILVWTINGILSLFLPALKLYVFVIRRFPQGCGILCRLAIALAGAFAEAQENSLSLYPSEVAKRA
jgi:hypothetical protein